MTSLRSWTTLAGIALSSLLALGCGSQRLRLASPQTTPGIAYTCTSATECYPASVATAPEGQEAEAITLTLPRECKGVIHEIVVREADSSSPEIDVTCGKQEAAAPAAAGGLALSQGPLDP